MVELYQQYYQLCIQQRNYLKEEENELVVEVVDQKDALIQQIKQCNEEKNTEVNELIKKIAKVEEENVILATNQLNRRRKEINERNKRKQQINQFI